MSHSAVLRSALVPALLFLSAVGTVAGGGNDQRPNVVIFLADDAGWGDYSGNGNQSISTPHIDSIAAGGARLERFFVCPVCSPTRAEFLTGRYHSRMGVSGTSLGAERMDLGERTLAEAFQQAGYATGAFGKWHNGSQWPYHPMARGFDEYYGHTAGHWGEYFNPPLEHNGRPVREQGYIVDLCTDKALSFLERHADRRFLCYVPFTTPHSPWAAPEENWRRFKDKQIAQPASVPKQEDVDHTRCALAMLENQDWNVGRVLAKLDELGVADNTIVLYFSDNGPNSWRWNDGMRGRKGSTDEGGIRSICYLRWSRKLPPGRSITQIAGAIDLLPTLTSLAGVDRVGDRPLDGRDLTPLLLGEAPEWPDRMLFSTWGNKLSVRTQRYRLDHQGELYDMQSDPGQSTPVTQQHPEIAQQLASAAQQWRESVENDKAAADDSRDGRRGGKSVDPRPFPVGYREFPRTWLPARDGEPLGGVRRSSGAPNCSYFVDWTSTDDAIEWSVDVHTAGMYDVVLDYTCPVEDAGSTIELSLGNSRLSGSVQPGWDPPLYDNQDTLPRPPAESQMKEFRPLRLGTMRLEAGPGKLTLRATKIPGREVMDLRALTLTLQD